MRYQLILAQEAADELEALWESDPAAAALLDAIFEELEADQFLLDALTDHGFVHRFDPLFDVQRWQRLWNKGINLWRLKPMGPDNRALPYRVIYAYVPGQRRYVVLGIVPRSFNYDPEDERSQRILDAYHDL